MPFEFERLRIEGVILVKPKVFGDNRGFFMESYKKSEFIAGGINTEFRQDNHSKSSKGVLRGLHYQAPPFEQATNDKTANKNIMFFISLRFYYLSI